MKLVPAKCPSCGANLNIDENLKKIKCEYCHTEIIVDDAIEKHKVEISGKVKLDNSDKYNYALRQADKYASEILSKPLINMFDFNNVYNVYCKAEETEGSDNRVFLNRLDFIIKFVQKQPNLINFSTTITHFDYSKKMSILEIYKDLLSEAIAWENDEDKKREIKEKYEKEFETLKIKSDELKKKTKEQRNKSKKIIKIIFIIACILFIIGAAIYVTGQIAEKRRIEQIRQEAQQSDKENQIMVPNLKEKTLSEAEEILKKLGVKYNVNTKNPGSNGKNYASTEPDAIVKYQTIEYRKDVSDHDKEIKSYTNQNFREQYAYYSDTTKELKIDKRYEEIHITALTKEMINHTGEYRTR